MKGLMFWLALCLIWGSTSLIWGSTSLIAEPNPYEARILKKQITVSYQILMDMWHEELYFDMYNLGQRSSRKKLAKDEFAQRMVDLAWKPSLQPEQMRKMDILYRNFANLHVRMEFENKIDPTRKLLKDMVFTAILENRKWKFDLTQLIRIPYSGDFVDLKAEAAATKKQKLKQLAEAKAAEAAQKAAWAQRKKDFLAGKAKPTADEKMRLKKEARAAASKAKSPKQP